MNAKKTVAIGATLVVLALIGASLGRFTTSADAMADGMATEAMADGMATEAMADGAVTEAMADGMGADATLGSSRPEGALTDAEIAMVAVVAGNIDISYAHLALALSSDPDVRRFARTMLQDHAAVNEQAGALVARLGVAPVESDLSRRLQAQARTTIDELATLRGAAFDRRYADNELAYHEFVNTALRDQFIPAVRNDEFRDALQGALTLFEAHEKLASDLVESVGR